MTTQEESERHVMYVLKEYWENFRKNVIFVEP
jgi:hypothetical protein